MELADASADMAGLFARNDLANVIRGAVLSPALEVDPYYFPIVSNRSPLFKLPVDAVQRGRDHGLPTYNAAREVSRSHLQPCSCDDKITHLPVERIDRCDGK